MAEAISGAILGGTLVSGVTGYLGAKEQAEAAKEAAKAGKKGAQASVAEARRQFDLMRADTEAYRNIGEQALYELGAQFGLSVPDAQAQARREADIALKEGELNNLLQTRKEHAALRNKQKASRLTVDIQRARDELNALRAQPVETRPTGIEGGMYDVTRSPGYQFRLQEGQKALERAQAAAGGRYGGRAIKEGQRYAQDYAAGEYGNYLDRLYRLAGFGSSAVGTSAAAGQQTAGTVAGAYGRGAGLQANALLAGGQAEAGKYATANQALQGGISNYLLHDYLRSRQPRTGVPGQTPRGWVTNWGV